MRAAGPEAAQSAVMGLAGGGGLAIDVAGPLVLTDRNENPPIYRVSHSSVGGVPESDLPGAPGRSGHGRESALVRRESFTCFAHLGDQHAGGDWPDSGEAGEDGVSGCAARSSRSR
jgi:hypothetical protein